MGLFLFALAGMEGVAYLSHRYVMDGALWCLHRSHHEPQTGWFELNDVFGIFFALPSIALIYMGTHGTPWALPLGVGMTAYGFCYFMFHDVIVHRRVALSWRPGGRYFDRIIKAHHIHHSTHQRVGAVSFGFLWSPPPSRLRANRR